MPLFQYACGDCRFHKRHFIGPDSKSPDKCPKCEGLNYKAQLNKIVTNVEYTDIHDILENKIDPGVREIRERIGRETVEQDTKTLENIFTKEKVSETFYQSDGWGSDDEG